jgi:ribosomal protein S12 methylthiotransferase accessory factor
LNNHMHYELRLETTASGVGYFACHPSRTATFDENLAYLRACPLDEFMHKHLLDMVGDLDEVTARRILELATGRDPYVEALICEASVTVDRFAALRASFDRARIETLLPYTPLVYMKSSLLEDQKLHNEWTRLFEANLSEHRPVPTPESAGLPLLYTEESLRYIATAKTHVKQVYKEAQGKIEQRTGVAHQVPVSAEETARRALEKLEQIDIFAGDEMKHASSLSPYGFLRKWRLGVSVRSGRLDYSVTGIQTSYGKGLTPEAARASYAMEMVERASSFACVGPEGVLDRTREKPLVRARLSELSQGGRDALNPNDLRLEVPCGDEPIYWMEAMEPRDFGLTPRLLPAQAVFLFCNLDEISLFSGLGSTGLASGNSIEQAKVSALLEVIERDCEATTLYEESRCFRIEAEDPLIGSLLSDYASRGVQVQFQDLTAGWGVPCYKCFVIDPQGRIIKGTGAHLDAGKALLSALTETPYGYPEAVPSAGGPVGLPMARFEELPDYSSGSPSGDLDILEALLAANGFRPLYVDLTRKDLGIPVVRAIVPGMEIMADFDRYSRVSPRLFAGYMRAAGRL